LTRPRNGVRSVRKRTRMLDWWSLVGNIRWISIKFPPNRHPVTVLSRSHLFWTWMQSSTAIHIPSSLMQGRYFLWSPDQDREAGNALFRICKIPFSKSRDYPHLWQVPRMLHITPIFQSPLVHCKCWVVWNSLISICGPCLQVNHSLGLFVAHLQLCLHGRLQLAFAITPPFVLTQHRTHSTDFSCTLRLWSMKFSSQVEKLSSCSSIGPCVAPPFPHLPAKHPLHITEKTVQDFSCTKNGDNSRLLVTL
jgi:hypothetical protein